MFAPPVPADISLQPPMDGLSSISWSGDSSKLLVSSWDGSVQVHDTSALQGGLRPPTIFPTQVAVLAATFSSQTPNGRTAYSGGLDKRLREWDFETGQNRVLGKADDAISTVTACGDSGIVITVVSMAHRNVHVYDVRKLEEPKQKRESALKFMTRSVACMADGKGECTRIQLTLVVLAGEKHMGGLTESSNTTGWASGSIEGRIAVEYFDAELESRNHNTFASGGSDGTVSIWDHNAKKRMKQYPHFPTEVSCLAFSPDGEKLAIGVSYEHDNGVSQADEMSKTALLIKTTVMDDCRPKTKAA
ncbi:hypothetical protein QFC19_001330 [Naganishia cerealis]|uniref:Uncharacterized protein n=1 Tax=Naganishia cerealis TaxID=610337 RepID=A0ACC2WJZ6_9TREE|nr:hypothetical protein QFC19_001330 [Naganishia cerealis]